MKPSHGGFRIFFRTGTYVGIGTTCVEFENVMKSASKKKIIITSCKYHFCDTLHEGDSKTAILHTKGANLGLNLCDVIN